MFQLIEKLGLFPKLFLFPIMPVGILPAVAAIAAIAGTGYGIYAGERARGEAQDADRRRQAQAAAARARAQREQLSNRLNAEKVAARSAKLTKSRKKRRDARQSQAAALYQAGGFPGRPQGSGGSSLGVGNSMLGPGG